MKTRYYIGIDPDLTNTGIAIWDSEEKKIQKYYSNSFWGLVKDILAGENKNITYVIEAGYLNKKSNYHINHHTRDNVFVRETIAKKVGENHAVAKILVELFNEYKLTFIERKPLHKQGMKREGSWTVNGRTLFKKITGIESKINDDCRDAVLLVLNL